MIYNLTAAEYFRSFVSAESLKRPIAPAPFVTIGREAGTGGHALAKALLARLAKEKGAAFSNWHVFDRALCEEVAKNPDLRVSLDSLVNEEFHEGLDDYFRTLLADKSSQLKIDHHVFRTIRSICSLGKAVIIGRAGALVTRGLPRGVRVRLVSAREARAGRIGQDKVVTAAAARKLMDQQDSRRERMVMSYFKKDVADPLLYDCVWNIDTVSADEMAESLVVLIRRRATAD